MADMQSSMDFLANFLRYWPTPVSASISAGRCNVRGGARQVVGRPCQADGVPSKTQYYTAMSIDGYIADPGYSLDWLFQAGTSTAKEDHFGAFFSQVGAMAMGAATYLWALEHDQLLQNPGQWEEYYGTTPCWIFTHRELPAVPGADLRFVDGQIPPAHEQMARAAQGQNVWVVGGGNLAGQFADCGLIDEILLTIAPAILGGGVPVLPRRLPASSLTLASVEHDQRFTFLTYRVNRHEHRNNPA